MRTDSPPDAIAVTYPDEEFSHTASVNIPEPQNKENLYSRTIHVNRFSLCLTKHHVLAQIECHALRMNNLEPKNKENLYSRIIYSTDSLLKPSGLGLYKARRSARNSVYSQPSNTTYPINTTTLFILYLYLARTAKAAFNSTT